MRTPGTPAALLAGNPVPRGPAALTALVALLAVGAAGPGPARAQPAREFPTVVALGAAVPLATGQGLTTPVAVVDHESGGYVGAGRFSLQLRTSRLEAAMVHTVAPALALGYGAGVQVISEGDGADLYAAGARQREATFQGDSAAATLTATLFPDAPWRLGWEGERRRTRFRPADEAAPGFVPPGNFTAIEHRLRARRQGLPGSPKGHAVLTVAWGRRTDWRPWSLDAEAAAHARYRKHALRWEQPVAWSGRQRSELKLAALGGADLDVLSGYRVGGFGGREVVAGYYRNEFRARRAVVLNAQHEWRPAEDRRLQVLLDAARLAPLALPFAPDAPERRRLVGVGVGVYWGLRTLGGLPVILRYGEGLRVPEGSPEGHRREVLLLVAAGF